MTGVELKSMSCEDVRAMAIDTCWETGGDEPTVLPGILQSHLKECSGCREFLNDLVALRRMCAAADEEPAVDLGAIQKALLHARFGTTVDRLGRHPAKVFVRSQLGAQNDAGFGDRPGPDAGMERGASLLEKLAFMGFAAAVAVLQGAVARWLQPGRFLMFTAVLWSLMPWAFLLVFLVDRRSGEAPGRGMGK